MELSQQLRDKGLKATSSRLSVMEFLGNSHQAYAHADLEIRFADLDRVTLYRVLNDFEEVGIVHKIIDAEGVTRFAICGHACPDEHHTDDHVHFNCQKCNKMFCMEKVHAPQLKMPQGFKATGSNTVIFGLCKHCSEV